MDTENSVQADKKVIMMAGFLGSVLIILMVTTFVLSKLQKSGVGNQIASNDAAMKTQYVQMDREPVGDSTITPTVAANAVVPNAAPEVNFRSWNDLNPVKITRTTSPVYELKQSYTFDEARDLAAKLDAADTVKKNKDTVVAYRADSASKTGAMVVFDTQNGQFTYTSTQGKELPVASDDIHTGIYEFTKTLNLYDPSLTVSASYKNRQYPDLTFYELHRDWNTISGPILNTVGLLNLSEDQNLSTMTLTSVNLNTPEDTDIYDSSDKRDGFERPNDFNTITVALTADKRVKFMQSNLRRLNNVPPKELPLISYEKAKSMLQNKQYSFLLTTPAGAGNVPWANVYPANHADAQSAVITEAALTYLESPPAAHLSELAPYFVFKGYSQLDSGFRVNYVAAVPATAPDVQSRNVFSSFIKDAYAQQSPDGDNGQKQGTFDLSPSPSVQPTPIDETSCNPTTAQLNPVYEINGVKFGWANVKIWQGKLSSGKRGWWYLIPKASTTDASLKDEVNQAVLQVRSLTNETDFREFDKILTDFQLRGNNCPVRITGASPSIFVYGAEGSAVKVTTGAELTYADPVTTHEQDWNVVVHANGLTVNGYNRPYIYYEYKPVAFSKPAHGWVVAKDQLTSVVSTVSKGLGLTDQETQRALFELNHAASSVSSGYVYVSLVQTNELAQRVPLTVSPQPDHLYRYHFYVSSAQKTDRASAPQLSPVVRSGLTVLEIGSAAQ